MIRKISRRSVVWLRSGSVSPVKLPACNSAVDSSKCVLCLLITETQASGISLSWSSRRDRQHPGKVVSSPRLMTLRPLSTAAGFLALLTAAYGCHHASAFRWRPIGRPTYEYKDEFCVPFQPSILLWMCSLHPKAFAAHLLIPSSQSCGRKNCNNTRLGIRDGFTEYQKAWDGIAQLKKHSDLRL